MHARNTDPGTSHAAAAALHQFSGKLQDKLLDELAKNGPGTYEELAARTGLRPDQVWRRLSDMGKRGTAVPTDIERRGTSGRMQRVWRAL